MSVESALFNYNKRMAYKPTKKETKNKQPESQVVKEILYTLNKRGWFLNRYESKSIYNPYKQKYLGSYVPIGHPDIAGITVDGLPCYLEVKAPGKRSTLKDHQREFLIKVINKGAFAGVFDSDESVMTLYNKWIEATRIDRRSKVIHVLINALPTKKENHLNQTPLF